LAERALDATYEVFGRHPGFRAQHAKGTFCQGTFKALPAARELTTAPHMQGDSLEAVVRFSKGSGNPSWPDGSPDTRGMAVKLRLPSGGDTDIVAATLPSFFVSRPEDFIGVVRSLRPYRRGSRKPNLLRVGWHMLRHRESRKALWSVLTIKPALSYATTRYNALHAYGWIDAAGAVRHVRCTWMPEAGEVNIRKRQATKRGPDYLNAEIADRLAGEGARFTLQVQIAGEGDDVTDPASPWPTDRETIAVGTLSLDRMLDDPERDGQVLAFDPTRITDGIELSGDLVLRFRPSVYELSAERRSAASGPPSSA
jgi:catalase